MERRRQAIPNTEARKGMMAKCLQSDMWNRQKSGSGLSELRGQKDFFFFFGGKFMFINAFQNLFLNQGHSGNVVLK